MNFDLFGFIVLLLALIVATFIQAAAALGTMYALHNGWPIKPDETPYGEFDFDNFQKPAFYEMLTRLLVIFLGPTLIIHVLEFLIVSVHIKAAPLMWSFALLVLETAAIAAGFVYILKLDRQRAVILTAVSGVVYLLLLWGVLYSKLV